MPYWSIYCLYCSGYIIDALLECVPRPQRSSLAFALLLKAQPGAALACPYCNRLFGFDANGQPQAPHSGWPVFRYGKAELELKKGMDGDPPSTALTDWALKHRFTRPGSHRPLTGYTYAEDAPQDETVP